MDTSLLSSILSDIQTVATFIGVIAGGTILTYFLLPHIAGTIHHNFKTLIWVTICISFLVLVAQPNIIQPIIILFQYGFSKFLYQWLPYQYAVTNMNTLLAVLSLMIVRISLFPEQHHSQVHAQ